MVLAHDISKGDRTRDIKITQNITFESMLLARDTMEGLKDAGFHKPSPIQLYGIPIGKCGFDLLLEAKSGTGKTAVFSIIALEKLDFCKGLQVIILTPTREIAAQICDVLKQIGSKYKELRVEVVMGGLPLQDDIEKFKKPVHIVVGSPGRMKHLIQNKFIDIKSVRLLVLDEADKLMENSFQSDVKYIHTTLPKQKQVIMSSATYPQSSKDVINTYVQNASHVCPDSDCILLGIDQRVTYAKYNTNIIRHTQDRFNELHKILGRLQFKQCLVFCNYQVRVAEIHNMLRKADWPSQKLYGQQEQVDRLDALRTLQQYKCRILVSTDLAARGIDSSNIDLVINFEPPYEWQTYLHRIGRAGRFGSYGLAITILSKGKEEQKFKAMFKSMELSVNMRYLWNDKEYKLSDSATDTHKDECCVPSDKSTDSSEEVYENMWELLSSKTNVKDFIDTVKLQYTPSENLEVPKIEPFSDLMLSLEDNSQDNEEEVAFKHIEMRETLTNKSIVSQNPLPEKEIKDMANNNNKNSTNYINGKENRSTSDTGADMNNQVGKINGTSEIMSNLDLPKMFSSSKLKTYDTKRKTNNTITENKSNSRKVNKYENFEENNVPSLLDQNVKIPATNGDIDNDSHHYIQTENGYRNKTKDVNNYYKNTNNSYEKEFKRNTQKQNYARLQSKVALESYSTQKEISKSYNNWYNELKMRMKQIEQSIYIHEMSNF